MRTVERWKSEEEKRRNNPHAGIFLLQMVTFPPFFLPSTGSCLNLSRDINRERDNVVAVAPCMTNETDIACLHERHVEQRGVFILRVSPACFYKLTFHGNG